MLLTTPPAGSPRNRLVPGLSLRAGDVLHGSFRVTSLLRADRACAHFAGTQTGTNEEVEVEVLLPTEAEVEPARLRLLEDARKVAVLRGPHVARVLLVGTTSGHPFVVREPRSGQLLASILEEKGSLSNEGAVEIAVAVCAALESAHAVGILHGELGPSSVELTYTLDGPTNIKVADLGTARALAMLPFELRPRKALTIRAPELLHATEAVDARADIWGVGVLLYTMLAGEPPFASESPSTLNLSVALDEPAMVAGVPDGLAEIVDACLARKASDRPGSAAELAAMLAPFRAPLVFAKRSSLLVVDAGSSETLLGGIPDAAPSSPARGAPRPEASASSLDVVIDVAAFVADEDSDRDVTRGLSSADLTPEPVVVTTPDPAVAKPAAPAVAKPTAPAPVIAKPAAPEVAKAAAPAVVASSVAPVAIPLAPLEAREAPKVEPLRAQLAPSRPARRWSSTATVAALCVAVGVVIGASSMRLTSRSSTLGAVEAPPPARVEAPPPARVEAPPPARVEAPAPRVEPATTAPAMPALAVGDLPAAVSTAKRPAAGAAVAPSTKTRGPASPAPHAAAPADVDPIVRSAAAPIQPEPKASDDDLRKFLDDRR
jgi:serine/threonine-protein kinase